LLASNGDKLRSSSSLSGWSRLRKWLFVRSTGCAIVRDLNDVRVVELPWLVTPDAPQLASYPRRDFASAPLDRL